MRCRTVFFAEMGAPQPAVATPDVRPVTEPALEEPAQSPANSGAGDHFEAMPADADMADAWAAAQAEEVAERAAARVHDAGADDDMQALVDGPSIIPAEEGSDERPRFRVGEGPFPMTGGDIDIFTARRARQREKKKFKVPLPKFHWPLAALPTAALALGTIVVVLIGWRTQVVRLAPQTASFYASIGLAVNLRGLELEDIKTSRETHEGIPVLSVEGEIVSVADKPVPVPRLRFAVRNVRGNEIYTWTAMPSRVIAAPGETVTFRSRLASPPDDAHDIVVRFYNRRDAALR
jgi:hypothetical protein